MKRIEAIIRPHRLDEVIAALVKLGIPGVTVLETRGFGNQLGQSEVFHDADFASGFVPKRMLVMYVADATVPTVVQCIRDTAETGKFGDGKIAVCDLDNLIRIRTGEEGEGAV